MRNKLTLAGILILGFALFVIWGDLSSRIVAVESATGTYVYSDADALEDIEGVDAENDLEAIYERIETLENAVSANAEALESVLQRLAAVERGDEKSSRKVRSREVIYFEHDESALTAQAVAKIDNVLLGIGDDAIVSLRGHADTVGNNRHNYLLSLRRAAAVKSYMEARLSDAGRIDSVLITIDGIGEESAVSVTADGVEEPGYRIVEILVFD